MRPFWGENGFILYIQYTCHGHAFEMQLYYLQHGMTVFDAIIARRVRSL